MASENRSASSTARAATTDMTTAERIRRFGPRPEWAHAGVILRPTEVQRGAGYAGILLDALRRERRHRAIDEGHIVRGGDVVKSVRKILSAHHIATCGDNISPGRFNRMPPTQIATQTIIVNSQTIVPVIFTDGTAIIFTRENAIARKGAPAWRYPPWAWRLEGAAVFTPPDIEDTSFSGGDPIIKPGKAARSRTARRATTIRGEVTFTYASKAHARANIKITWQKTPAKADRSRSSHTIIWPAPENDDEKRGAEKDFAEKNAARRCFTDALNRDLEAISKAALAAPTQNKSQFVDVIEHHADLITSTTQRLAHDMNALVAGAVIAANKAVACGEPYELKRKTAAGIPTVILLGASHNAKAGFTGKGPGGRRSAMIVAEALRRRGVKIDLFGQKYTRNGSQCANIIRNPVAYFYPAGSETNHQVISALREWPEINEIAREDGFRDIA